MNIMKRILLAASMVVSSWFLTGVQIAAAGQPVAGQPTISLPATATWAQMQTRDAQLAQVPLLKAPQVAAPFMPSPADIQITASPATLPAAPTTHVSQALFPGPVSVADQISAPVPAAGGALAPALGASFQGLGDNNTSIPPDTMGAVGPNHVMTMLNSQVRIQNRAGTIISTVTSASFWQLAGPKPFDPHVVYDTLSNRWIATCDGSSKSTASKVYFAISLTNNPTGVWTFYSFVADRTGTNWADYPGLGINAKWIAITNNMFTVAANKGIGAKLWVIDKSTALAGGALTTTVFPTAFDGGGQFTLKPAVTFDAAEPNLYIVNNGISSGLGANDFFRLSRITGTAAAPIWSTVPDAAGLIPGSGFVDAVQRYNSSQVNAAQLGSTKLISSGDIRVMNAVFRNGHLWFAHSGGFPNEPVSAAIRTDMFWYEVNPRLLNTSGLPVIQSGTGIASFTANAGELYPTIAVNKFNDAVIGFTLTKSSRYAGAWVKGRKSTDAPGTMTGAILRNYKAGLAPYFKTFAGTRNRWGDYSATMADPLNNGDFWTLQEYAEMPVGTGPNKDRWGTWWAQVKMGRASARNDFNGDRKSDILYRQTSSGRNFIKLMNGRTVLSQGFAGLLPTSWTIVGSGDYNGDGKSDILYRQASSGRNFIKLMNGRTVLSQGFAGLLPTSWTIVGSGDYNGDGKSDILYRQASSGRLFIKLMNGRKLLSQGFAGRLPTSWTVVGNGDYNGDGKSDILYRQASSGRLFIKLMNGRTVLSQGFAGRLPASWSVVNMQ